MCMYCHRDDKAFDVPNSTATYMSVHLAAHGDGNADCVRLVQTEPVTSEFQGSSYVNDKGESFKCIDCGELVRIMDLEDHCCYTDS